MTNLPTPSPDGRLLDRAALERVLARAMELHVQGDDVTSADGVSEARIVEIAREVGIAPEAVRQAIAEERARAPLDAARRQSETMPGDPSVSAARVLKGTPSELLARIEAQLTRDESLGVIRRYPDRLVFEPRRGLMDQVARAVDVGGKGYHLSRASEVAVSVSAIDTERSHVAVAADLRRARNRQMAAPATLLVIGSLAAVLLAILTVYPWIAAVPPLALAWLGWVWARRAWRTLHHRVRVSLERVLDRLEYPAKPTAAQQLIDGLTRGILPPR